MAAITALTPQRRSPARRNLYLDGRFVGRLDAALVAARGLAVGQVLDPDEVASLTGDDERQRAHNTSLRFLGQRPRSEAEVRGRLGRAGFSSGTIMETITWLRGQGLIDDAAFAEQWAESRTRTRGTRRVAHELRAKGVAAETIAAATNDLDDDAAAARAARGKVAALAGLDARPFRQRLSAFLLRRGFGYETVDRVVRRLLRERLDAGDAD